MPERIVLTINGQQRTYTADSDGVMWRYRTPEGWRWIGWRALAEKFERALEGRVAPSSESRRSDDEA